MPAADLSVTSSPETLILRFLAAQAHSSAAEIGRACNMTAAEVRARLVMLESMRLVSGRQYAGTTPPRRAYVLTGEGRLKAEATDARYVR